MRQARRCARSAQSAAKRFPTVRAEGYRELGIWAARRSRLAKARRWLARSLAVGEELGAAYEIAATLAQRAKLGSALGWPEARDDQLRSDQILDNLGIDWQVPQGPPRAPKKLEAFPTVALVERFSVLLEQGRRLTRSQTVEDICLVACQALGQLLRSQSCGFQDGNSRPPGISSQLVERALNGPRPVVDETNPDRSLICAPVIVHGQSVGYLFCSDERRGGLFGSQELLLAEFVASLAGAAWENAQGLARNRETEGRFQTLFAGAGVGLILVDMEGCILDVNPSAARLVGRSSGELLGTSFQQLLWPPDREAEASRFKELQLGKTSSYHAEVRHRRTSGQPSWIQLSAARLEGSQQVLRALSDVSYRRLAQVVRFQEIQSQLLSLELHDVVAQDVASLCQMAVAEDPAALRQAAEVAARNVRALIRNLKNPIVTGMNPLRAVLRMARQSRKQAQWELRLQLSQDGPRLPKLTAIFLYRIVQEALHNITRHSNTRRVLLRVESGPAGVRGWVRDYGQGLGAEAAQKGRLGIDGMRHRARLLGGQLKISSRKGKGVRVWFWLPARVEVPRS